MHRRIEKEGWPFRLGSGRGGDRKEFAVPEEVLQLIQDESHEPDGFSEFWLRLEFLMDGEKPHPWAKRIGLGAGVMQGMMERQTLPKAATLIAIAKSTHCSLDWLMLGIGEPFWADARDEIPPSKAPELDFDALKNIFAALERFEQKSDRIYSPERKAMIVEFMYKNYNKIKDVLDVVLEATLKAAA